jgi:hypothetical protein
VTKLCSEKKNNFIKKKGGEIFFPKCLVKKVTNFCSEKIFFFSFEKKKIANDPKSTFFTPPQKKNSLVQNLITLWRQKIEKNIYFLKNNFLEKKRI